MRIGVFDSGVGGLNVLSSLEEEYPNNEYYYFGDTKNLPYGDKSKKELMLLATNAIDFLLTKNVDIIIIACGTISSNCYHKLKKKYQIPLYDIISPTINYLKNTDIDKIGVIATKRTINSKIFDIPGKNVLMKATPSFVPIIENNQIEENKEKIIKELTIFKNYDVLVLGCTHYPLLKELIEKEIKVKVLDMGKCLRDNLSLTNNTSSKTELYFSQIDNNLLCNIQKIMKNSYEIKEK